MSTAAIVIVIQVVAHDEMHDAAICTFLRGPGVAVSRDDRKWD